MQHRRSFFISAVAVVALNAIPVPAQQPGVRYSVSLRYRVDPAKLAEHREFVKNTSTKVMAEWLKTNPKLLSWSGYELSYGGAPLADYNFVSSFVYDGPPPEDTSSTFQSAVRNAGMSYEAYQTKQRSLRTLVGQQLRRTVASAGTSAGADWSVVTFLKAAPNKRADLLESQRTVNPPVYTLMANDHVISGWGLTEVVFPRGQDFDFVVSTTYPSLADAAQYGALGRSYATYFAKAHPGKNYISFVDSYRSSQASSRSDLLHRIARVAR